jgi:hypothetical protein
MDLPKLKNYLSQEKDNFDLICDNYESKKFFVENNFDAKVLEEFFPRYSKLQYKIFEKTKDAFIDYDNICNSITFDKYSISTGLLHNTIDDLLYLEKIKKLFEYKKSKIFIFKKNKFRSLLIQLISKENGFDNDNEKIHVVKKGNLFSYDIDESVTNLENSKSIKYKKSFSVYAKNIGQSSNKISFFPKLVKKTVPMILRLSSSKLYEINPDSAKKLILKNVENKIKNDDIQVGFFLSSDKDDLFKHFSKIFNKLSKENISYSIFTIDPLTGSFSKNDHQFQYKFFEEIQILANVIKKTKQAKIFEEKLKKIAIAQKLFLIYNRGFNLGLMDGLYRVFATFMILEHVLKKINLRNAVIIDGTMLGSVVANLGKVFGFSTTSIEYLLIDNNPILSLLIKGDKICTYGEQGKQSLINLGFSDEAISITGNPKYDYISLQDINSSKKILKKRYKIDDGKKLITIAMSRWHINDELWISDFIKFCNKNNFEIMIKLHPRYKRDPDESEDQLTFIQNKCKKEKFHISFDLPLDLLLSASDIVISDYSNVGVEAVLLKKIVINQNFIKENLEFSQNYHEIGSVFYTESYDELEKIVKEIFSNKQYTNNLEKGYNEMVKKYNFKNDGKSSQRICQVIKESLR